jgi:hypothetical protein
VKKRCTKCGELKSLEDFYAAKGTKDGLRGDCKECHSLRAKDWYAKNRERSIAYVKRWQQENKERVNAFRRARNATRRQEIREGHLKRTFGLTLAEYAAILEAQGCGCAICGDVPEEGKSLHVDHDHDTRRIHGLLCFRCNGGLGQFSDDIDRLATAMAYIGKSDQLTEAIVERARGLRAA